ncbi:hypothetical protein FQR65_LT11555 [Abscondita terminalis]|nr:hypothetical protein FQR65_LT11555 [Abscondita terminalis]
MVIVIYVFIIFLISPIVCVNNHDVFSILGTTPISKKLCYDEQNRITNIDTINTYNEQTSELVQHKPPQFVKSRRMNANNIVKPVGSTAYFKCKSTGYPRPDITWTKNFKKPVRQLGYFIWYQPWNLILDDLILDDSGTYTCNVCNKLGCISHNYTLDVVELYHTGPILIDRPQNQTVTYGSNVKFSCKFLSDLNAVIYWVAGTYDEKDRYYTVKTTFNELNPQILELNNVTYADEGWYTCVAANTIGTTSTSSYLKVVDDTTFNELNPQILELNNVTYADEGWYTCVAANTIGTTSTSSYLKVVDDVKITNVTENALDLKSESENGTTRLIPQFSQH